MGYHSVSQYRVYDPITRNLICSTAVVFYEDKKDIDVLAGRLSLYPTGSENTSIVPMFDRLAPRTQEATEDMVEGIPSAEDDEGCEVVVAGGVVSPSQTRVLEDFGEVSPGTTNPRISSGDENWPTDGRGSGIRPGAHQSQEVTPPMEQDFPQAEEENIVVSSTTENAVPNSSITRTTRSVAPTAASMRPNRTRKKYCTVSTVASVASYTECLSSASMRLPVTRANPAKNHSPKVFNESAVTSPFISINPSLTEAI